MKTNFLSTAIGSMPFGDPEYAVSISLKSLDAPIWPQLSKQSYLERMEIQYSENMPCVIIDKLTQNTYFKTNQDYSDDFVKFYEKYLSTIDMDNGIANVEYMAISKEFSKGIYALEDALKTNSKKVEYLKVQSIGPLSFSLIIMDENKKAIYYNEEFRDMIVKSIAMNCRWQIQKFNKYAENIICFIDEPILSAFGSSVYISVEREDIVNIFKEIISAIKAENGISGIHCCGNTEWSILVDAGVDIVSFDAFNFANTIALYFEHIKTHLERGGILAWGVVPTSSEIMVQTVESLEIKLEEGMDNLASKGISKDLIVQQAIITPSCGTGFLSVEEAERVFELLSGLSKRMKGKYSNLFYSNFLK